MSALKPSIQLPWYEHRQRFNAKLKELQVRPGDVLLRLGDAVAEMPITTIADPFSGIVGNDFPFHNVTFRMTVPFSPAIAAVTKSEFSHAAMVFAVGERVEIAEVDAEGFSIKKAVDWVNHVVSDTIVILRFKGDDVSADCLRELGKIADQDPSYDGEFHEDMTAIQMAAKTEDQAAAAPGEPRLYCTKLIYKVAANIGKPLGPPTPLGQLEGWNPLFTLCAGIGKVPSQRAIYHVGNERQGLLAEPLLYTFATVKLADFAT